MSKRLAMSVDDVVLPDILERNRLVDTDQSAKFLNITVWHLRRLYNTGKIERPIKIGGRKGGYTVEYLMSLVAARSDQEAA